MAQFSIPASLALLALLSNEPLVLVSAIISTAILALASEVLREWASWWKLCLVMGVVAVIINPIVSRAGATVIWRGPALPALGRLTVSLESLAYGAAMALRLAAVIWALALLSLTVDPDRVLGLLKGGGSSSALVSALSLRMVPTAARDASSILDAQRSRGIARDSGSRRTVLKSRLPLIKNLVLTSLDRAVNLAEAMEARAYGTGRRTRFKTYRFAAGCYLAFSVSLAVIALGTAGAVTGYTSVNYYPSINWNVSAMRAAFALAPLVLAGAVLLYSWSWKRWNWLRLRT